MRGLFNLCRAFSLCKASKQLLGGAVTSASSHHILYTALSPPGRQRPIRLLPHTITNHHVHPSIQPPNYFLPITKNQRERPCAFALVYVPSRHHGQPLRQARVGELCSAGPRSWLRAGALQNDIVRAKGSCWRRWRLIAQHIRHWQCRASQTDECRC